MRLLAASLLLPAALLTACGTDDAGGAEGPAVITSFYPLQFVTERVAGGQADVQMLTAAGAEPHDAELSVSQTADIMDADLMVYLSGFQTAVDEALDQADGVSVVDAADGADLLPASEEANDEHEGEQTDPHFWVDPTRLAAVAAEVADALAQVDPDNAEGYAARGEKVEAELLDLDQEIAEGLQDCLRDTVVVSHDAFGYFGERYGLELHSIAGLSPESEPSPQHLAELQELIRAQGITTVFSETLASPAMAETLSSDLGLETAVLDPIEGLGDETADEDYFSLMRQNLAALQQANECG